jgi:hypothetical protein
MVCEASSILITLKLANPAQGKGIGVWAIIIFLAGFAACHNYCPKLLISAMNLKFMISFNNETSDLQNDQLIMQKLRTVKWLTNAKSAALIYQSLYFKT